MNTMEVFSPVNLELMLEGGGSTTYREKCSFLNRKFVSNLKSMTSHPHSHRLTISGLPHNKFGSCIVQCQDPEVHGSLSFTSSSIILCFNAFSDEISDYLAQYFLTYINISLLALSLV